MTQPALSGTHDGIVDNLGIAPLAGLCTYSEALQPGHSVDQSVAYLKRLIYILATLNRIGAAHLPGTPIWEVKCALSHHLWLDAEHARLLRERVAEMREPPLHLDECPDDGLERWLGELIRGEDTVELLTGIYDHARPALLEALRTYMAHANPLADQPTLRWLRFIRAEQSEMVAWGRQALAARIEDDELARRSADWRSHLEAFLGDTGGVLGDQPGREDETLPAPRSDGTVYEMDPTPVRDDRLASSFDQSFSGEVSSRLGAELSAEERGFVLLFRRLQEMDVPEWMAPIIYKTEGKPWAYYAEMSRQLWDEARHAMMGEVGLYGRGIPFYAYPIALEGSASLNLEFTPLEAHILLWEIEQRLMDRKTGKVFELEMAQTGADPLLERFQDFDWADEVLHAQIGRRWLMPMFDSTKALYAQAEQLRTRWHAVMAEMKAEAEKMDWWPGFVSKYIDPGKESDHA